MPMNPGDTLRYDCPDCAAEFDVTYEPKCKGAPKLADGIEPKEGVAYCPFCGVELCNEEDVDTDGVDED